MHATQCPAMPWHCVRPLPLLPRKKEKVASERLAHVAGAPGSAIAGLRAGWIIGTSSVLHTRVELGDLLPKRPPREPAQPPINFSESAHAAAEPPVRLAQAAGCLTWLPPALLGALSTAEMKGHAVLTLFLRQTTSSSFLPPSPPNQSPNGVREGSERQPAAGWRGHGGRCGALRCWSAQDSVRDLSRRSLRLVCRALPGRGLHGAAAPGAECSRYRRRRGGVVDKSR